MKRIVLKVFLFGLLCVVIPYTLVFAESDTTTKETIEEQDTYIEEHETEIDLDLYNGDLEE